MADPKGVTADVGVDLDGEEEDVVDAVFERSPQDPEPEVEDDGEESVAKKESNIKDSSASQVKDL